MSQQHLPEHTVAAAVHADRVIVLLFVLFVTLPLTNTNGLGLLKVFLCMSIHISAKEQLALKHTDCIVRVFS